MDRNITSATVIAVPVVALRKESVDRNNFWLVDTIAPDQSLSARRAWIEIAAKQKNGGNNTVALRKESVDRNRVDSIDLRRCPGRSPQGERG